MTKGKANAPIDSHEFKEAIAALIANTKRIDRKLNLVEIAKKIDVAKKFLPTHKIADMISISPEMVREFTRISLLVPPVKRLILEGKLISIDIADRLSRLPPNDQLSVAKEVVAGNLSSEDVRAVVSMRKSMPGIDIAKIIQKIKKSRNIKEYHAEFVVPTNIADAQDIIRKNLIRIFGIQHIKSVSTDKTIGTIVLDAKGRSILVRKAREFRLSKGKMLQKMVCGEVK